jgi:hypothetical protein
MSGVFRDCPAMVAWRRWREVTLLPPEYFRLLFGEFIFDSLSRSTRWMISYLRNESIRIWLTEQNADICMANFSTDVSVR